MCAREAWLGLPALILLDRQELETAMPGPDLAFLLLRADSSEFGVSVVTNNPTLLRNQLYAERKKLGLTNLTIKQPPIEPESRLWIVKKDSARHVPTED